MSQKTINEAFFHVFRRIRDEHMFTSTPSTASAEYHDNPEIKAAISKCIEFNLIVNRERPNNDEAFLFLSGLRGIVEDLIVLKYSLRFSPSARLVYFGILQRLNLDQGILAQKKFFKSNNPFQAVVGSNISMEESQNRLDNVKLKLKDFWQEQGCSKKNGPSIKEMSEAVNLMSTYQYIYFAASNFVHFNPHALLRTGWGPEGGPFTFSIQNFSGYYRDLAAFYGAVLYVGFATTFGPLLSLESEFKNEISDIESILIDAPRWPELITFEELNLSAPQLSAEEKAIKEKILGIKHEGGEKFVLIDILNEIKGTMIDNS
ncbi:MAG: hypothetical protein KGH91_04110 [Rhodospirillales bacterium]|nr:hypothetical protein [Rhodospirillales bacterium]